MKELILFSFVVIFISCQNQSLPETTSKFSQARPAESAVIVSDFDSPACKNQADETEASFDFTQELQNPKAPGIYYRQVTLQSEMPTIADSASLVCVSQVSESDEDNSEMSEEPASEIQMRTLAATEPKESQWHILTEKWYPKKTNSCQNKNVSMLNPLCEPMKLMAGEMSLPETENAQSYQTLSFNF